MSVFKYYLSCVGISCEFIYYRIPSMPVETCQHVMKWLSSETLWLTFLWTTARTKAPNSVNVCSADIMLVTDRQRNTIG